MFIIKHAYRGKLVGLFITTLVFAAVSNDAGTTE